jgi:hypothetical protein
MKRYTLLLCMMLVTTTTTASGYYISDVTVTPGSPTTADAVTVTVCGNAPATNYALDHTDVRMFAKMIFLDMYWVSPGAGAMVLVPYSEDISLGALAEGRYTVYVRSYDAGLMRQNETACFTVAGCSEPDPWPDWSWSWSSPTGGSYRFDWSYDRSGPVTNINVQRSISRSLFVDWFLGP